MNRVTLDQEGFSLLDADGKTLHRHDWADVAEPTVTVLTSAFGVAPTLHDVSGDFHFAGGTAYEWNGFALIDRHLAPSRHAYSTFAMATASRSGTVEITTSLGIAVGGPQPTVRALTNEHFDPRPEQGITWYSDCLRTDPASTAMCFYGDESGVITAIHAPLSGL